MWWRSPGMAPRRCRPALPPRRSAPPGLPCRPTSGRTRSPAALASLQPAGSSRPPARRCMAWRGQLDEMAAKLLDTLPTVRFVVTLEPGSMPGVEGKRPVTPLETAIATAATPHRRRRALAPLPVQPPAVHPVLLRHHGRAEVHRARRRRHAARAREGAPAALRPAARATSCTSTPRCGWMMWNWQLSALASGAEIVLYDGAVRTGAGRALADRRRASA